MERISPIELLDNVLHIIFKHRVTGNDNSITEGGIISSYNIKHRDANISTGDARLIFEKLCDDGLIKKAESKGAYYLKYEGYVFEGYAQRKEREDNEAEKITSDLSLRKKTDRHLVLATALAGIGATLLVVWEIWKYYHCGCK